MHPWMQVFPCVRGTGTWKAAATGYVKMSVIGWGGMMGSVRKGLLAVAAVLVLFGAVPAMAQQRVIVQGNSRVEADTIRSFVTLAPGESYTAARIDQAIKDLYATAFSVMCA